MKSNTAVTSGSFRAVPMADQLMSVKPTEGPIGLAYVLQWIYPSDEECERALAEYKKQRHTNEIKEAGSDYEIQET